MLVNRVRFISTLLKKFFLLFSVGILSLNFYNTKVFAGAMSMKGPSEDEYMQFLQSFAQEYENMSPADKEIMSKELGIGTNEMDQLFNEIKTAIDESSRELENKKIEQPMTFVESTPKSQTPVQQSEIKSFEESLSSLYETVIKTLSDAVKVLDSLISKISASDVLRKNAYSNNRDLILNVKMATYYLSLLRTSLKDILIQKNITLPQNELEELRKNAQIILHELKDPVIALNVDAFNAANSNNFGQNNNLFQKYSARNQKELINKLQNENSTLKEKKKQLESKINSLGNGNKELIKTYKKSLISINHKIDEIQEDIQEVNENSDNYSEKLKEENKNRKKMEEIFFRNMNILIASMQRVFVDQSLTQSIETWVKKFLPQEFETGQKRKDLESKRLQEEANIANKGPQSSSRNGFATEQIAAGRSGYNDSRGREASGGSNSFFQEIDNADDKQFDKDAAKADDKKDDKGKDENKGSGKDSKKSSKENKKSPRGTTSATSSGVGTQPKPNKNDTKKGNKEPEMLITPEMILELLEECASLSDEKSELEKTLKAEKTSTEKAKKIQEALKAHNDLVKTKLQQLENFIKKISLQELEKKYINEDSDNDEENNKGNEDEKEKQENTFKTHTIKTWGEKIYTVLESDPLFAKVSNALKERINKLQQKPDWYISMKKEIAIREAEANINDDGEENNNREEEEDEEAKIVNKKTNK